MAKVKYFYNGVPLSEYCNKHNININTVRAQIWMKKKDKRYESCTDEEIIDMAIKSYGTKIKYMYNGVSLSEYCRKHGINKSTVRSKIWKMKKDKKYESYTDEEIIDMVIKSCGTNTKYMYKGLSLRQYCLNNNLNYSNILKRILRQKRKEKNRNLTDHEIVIKVMEKFHNKNFKYFYEGIPLVEYCKEHPEINYSTIKNYIKRQSIKNPNKTHEELIEEYINKEHKGKYTYYYQGVPLVKYCEENNIRYKNIIVYISCHKDDDEYKNLNKDEFIEAIMNNYEPFRPKYQYKGYTLWEYCNKNNIPYRSILTYIDRRIKKGSTKSIDELVSEGIKNVNRNGIMYYYKNIPLKKYCEDNNINYHSILSAIYRERADGDEPIQNIIDQAIESYQKFSIRYYYGGVPLTDFCKDNNINYKSVISRYHYKYKHRNDISIDDAIKEIVDYYLNTPPTRYYFGDQSLSRLCDKNGYHYQYIWYRIMSIKRNEPSLDKDKIVEKAVKKYEEQLHINKLSEMFRKLQNNELNKSEIKDFCDYLKIDFDNIKDLIDMDFSYNQAINLIWYFSDKKNDKDQKIITEGKFFEIVSLIEKLKKHTRKIDDFSLYDLIGIYKSELYDSRNEIIERLNKYIYKTINTFCNAYNIRITKDNLDDFASEIKLYIITMVDRICLNEEGRIIKYMDLTVKGYFRKYVKNYCKQSKNISLNTPKYQNNKGSKKEKTYEDYLADKNDNYEDNSTFSDNMMNVLSNLDKEDLSFIILKYQENYSDEELSGYFKISIDDVKEKELEIINLLRENDQIKTLIKRKQDN